MTKATQTKLTGYNWEAARRYNEAKREARKTGTPRAATNGNA